MLVKLGEKEIVGVADLDGTSVSVTDKVGVNDGVKLDVIVSLTDGVTLTVGLIVGVTDKVADIVGLGVTVTVADAVNVWSLQCVQLSWYETLGSTSARESYVVEFLQSFQVL